MKLCGFSGEKQKCQIKTILEFLSSFPSASDFRPQKKNQKRKLQPDQGEEGMWSVTRDQMSGGGAGESLRSFAHKSQRTEGRSGCLDGDTVE